MLADDHRIMQEGLKALIEKEPGLRVVGEAENGITTLRLSRKLRPDIVVMDISMPDMNGIEVTRQLLSELGGTKVIALSIHSDPRFVIEMLRAGASGYLLKQAAFEELLIAIKKVLLGRTYLGPGLLDSVPTDIKNHLMDAEGTLYTNLSNRERQILQLMVEGHSIKEMANSLHISVKTVQTHQQNVRYKLGIKSIVGLTKFAVQEGLTPLES